MAPAVKHVMIQVRNVPANVHRTLKARAAMAGMTLSDYLLAELKQFAEQPTFEELRARIRAMPRVKTTLTAAQIIREIRDAADGR